MRVAWLWRCQRTEYHPARLHTDPPGFAAWQGMARGWFFVALRFSSGSCGGSSGLSTTKQIRWYPILYCIIAYRRWTLLLCGVSFLVRIVRIFLVREAYPEAGVGNRVRAEMMVGSVAGLRQVVGQSEEGSVQSIFWHAWFLTKPRHENEKLEAMKDVPVLAMIRHTYSGSFKRFKRWFIRFSRSSG